MRYPVAFISAAAVVALAAAPASADHPREGTYAQFTHSGNLVIALTVDGSGAITPDYYNNCSQVPVVYSFKAKKNGSFEFNGTKTNVLDEKIKVAISGKFVSADKVKGTVKYTAKGCSARAKKFVAVFGAEPRS